MKCFVKFLVENSTTIVLVVAILSIVIYLFARLINYRKTNEWCIELQDLIQIPLRVSSLISGIILVFCSFCTDLLSSLQTLPISIFIAGLALIYISISSFFNKKSNNNSSQRV